MHKRIYWFVGILIFLLLASFIFYGVKLFFIRRYMMTFQQPPITIATVTAKSETWHPFLSAIGSLVAFNGVDVNPQVAGQVRSFHFKSGDFVKENDLLVELDDEIDLENLARDEAALQMNKLDYERKVRLLSQNAVASSAVDTAKAAYLQSVAAVASDKVMLGKKQIRAPFSGKIGIRQVNIGQYVSPGTPIVSLQALDPLYVDFSLPEQNISKLHTDQSIEIQVDAYPDLTFSGKIIALNSHVDIGTRSIDVRALIPNEKQQLYPGLFANVKVILPETTDVITIPQTAINYSLYGDSVYLVEDKGKDKTGKPLLTAVQKYIKVGDKKGSVAAILDGVNVGDEVVSAGQIKLQNNARVLINNSIQLKQ